jgi:hypothetical protein
MLAEGVGTWRKIAERVQRSLTGRCIKSGATFNYRLGAAAKLCRGPDPEQPPPPPDGEARAGAGGLGRRFVGIERDPKYCEVARRRLAEV